MTLCLIPLSAGDCRCKQATPSFWEQSKSSSILGGTYLEMQLSGHIVSLFSVLLGNQAIFSTMAASFYIPTSCESFSFAHGLTQSCCYHPCLFYIYTFVCFGACVCVCVCLLLGIEPLTLGMKGKHSTIELHCH